MVWFRLNIGRERNADPRWLLPLICNAGNISKAEIGSIKIFDRDTRFQIVADQADAFAEAVRNSKDKQGHISRVRGNNAADDATVMAAIGALQGSGQDNEPADTGSSIDQSHDDQAQADNRPAPRPKAPWRDRTKPTYQKRDHGSRDGGRDFAARDHAPRAHASRHADGDRPRHGAPRHGDAAPAAHAPQSDKPRFPKKDKYAHKKKPRPAEPAAG